MSYNEGKWSASDVGMTTAELVAIPANAWSSMINSAKYMQLKAILDGVDTVTKVKFNFNNDPEAITYTWGTILDSHTWCSAKNYKWALFKGV